MSIHSNFTLQLINKLDTKNFFIDFYLICGEVQDRMLTNLLKHINIFEDLQHVFCVFYMT